MARRCSASGNGRAAPAVPARLRSDPCSVLFAATPSPELLEAEISGNLQSTWTYAEEFVPEDEVLLTARAKGEELGCVPVGPGAGAALRALAAAIGARSVVEIGTGAGVGSLWLLRGMRPDGVLTTIDVEPEHHRAARETFAEASIPSNRVRLISGQALEVLPRLTDAAYDLVFCDANKAENPDYLDAAARLLRPGGMVVFAGALAGGRIAESSARDTDTVAMREFAKTLRDDERFVAGAVPVGTGLLVGARVTSA